MTIVKKHKNIDHSDTVLEINLKNLSSNYYQIKKVVSKNTELFLDGGIRRGEDIVKAHALGATAACSGRSWFWALAADGEQGVNRILEILEKEVEDTLALIGEPKLTDVGPQNLFST